MVFPLRPAPAVLNDDAKIKKIQEIHSPDGSEIDVKLFFNIVRDILNHAIIDDIFTATQMQTETEDKNLRANFTARFKALLSVIDKIYCEISYKILSGSDVDETVLSVFNMLSNYSWDAKLVLTMAAFALKYGELCLLAQIFSTDPFAGSILRQVNPLVKQKGSPTFTLIKELIRVMMDVTECIVEFRELPSVFISMEVSALSKAIDYIPTAVYWIIKSVVGITQITSVNLKQIDQNQTKDSSNLPIDKVRDAYAYLREQLEICLRHIDDKKNVGDYLKLLNSFDEIHTSNIDILKVLINTQDGIMPLKDCSTKKSVNIDVMRSKSVLLLISGLDLSADESVILEQIYSESKMGVSRTTTQYEIVWIPIVDYTAKEELSEAAQNQFLNLQSNMTWYSVQSPELIQKNVIRLIKEVWHFKNKPILVTLDFQGSVVCLNAFNMIWIWGSQAFPFTKLREEFLWKEEEWSLSLLVDDVEPNIMNWIREESYVFLYGGDDIEWIRDFTKTARTFAQAAGIKPTMMYVGKSNKEMEEVEKVITIIKQEKLSEVWENPVMIWFFWTRIERMFISLLQLGNYIEDGQEIIMQEIQKLLSYDKEDGWALFSKGRNIEVIGLSTTILSTLKEYDEWKKLVSSTKSFELCFKQHHDKLRNVDDYHHCCRFNFPSSIGRIPHRMICPECHRTMKRRTTLICCQNEAIAELPN